MRQVTIGDYRIYKNKREIGRKFKELSNSLLTIAGVDRNSAVWRVTKSIPRSKDPYARHGFISWKITILVDQDTYDKMYASIKGPQVFTGRTNNHET